WLGLAGWASGQGVGVAGAPVDEAAKRLAVALARVNAWRALRKAAPAEASTEAFRRSEALALRAAESAFIDALAAAPDDAAAAEEARRFYAESGHWDAPPSAGMLDLIARSPDPAILAMRLAGHSGEGYHGQSVSLLLAALAVRPGSAPLWFYAAEAVYVASPSWQIAFLEQSLRCLAPPGSSPEGAVAPAAAAIAERLLSMQLDSGLVPRALATWRELPPAVRAVVESGATGQIEAEIGGVPLTGELRDLRLDLAAAAMLAGNPADARRLLAMAAGSASSAPGGEAAADLSVPAASMATVEAAAASTPEVAAGLRLGPAHPSPEWRWAAAARGRTLKRQLLERWLASPRDDPFGLLVQILTAESGGSESDSFTPACWQLALARVAEREGYPEITAYALTMLERRGLHLIAGDDEIAGAGRGLPPSVLMGARGAAADIVRLGREIDEDAQAARARARAALGPDPAAPVIDRLLRAPSRAAFMERPLPADLEAPAAGGARNRARETFRLPAGFTAVRSERQGKQVAVIALSQVYDQQSPASSGGYWLLLSDEQGTTWRRPLYTGLRANLPYTVREQSALPLLAGDHLQVEVVVEELGSFFTSDESGPAELAPRQPRSGIYLEIPTAELARDSDGDGLADLEEERLLTDPEDADTDHDGIGDAEDPMPTVAAVDTPSPAAGAAAALLEHVLADAGKPPAPPRRARFGGCCAPAPAAPLGGRTVFVTGERQWFAGLRPPYRLIVLTAEELETWQHKVTTPFFFGINLLVLDRSGRRACAVWVGNGRGGTVALEQKAGAWQVEEIGYWVS
ncbi:MAG: hypothetical protein JOZ15_10345, partial [Acidobacteria bacterium]|nr:hypothetical protein [Acidobacteriota bacterium]